MRKNVNFKRFPRCKKTGRIFDSIYDAAIFFKVSHQTIINYCNPNKKEKDFDLDLEWCSVADLSREIRILKDDLNFYQNAARFQDLKPKAITSGFA